MTGTSSVYSELWRLEGEVKKNLDILDTQFGAQSQLQIIKDDLKKTLKQRSVHIKHNVEGFWRKCFQSHPDPVIKDLFKNPRDPKANLLQYFERMELSDVLSDDVIVVKFVFSTENDVFSNSSVEKWIYAAKSGHDDYTVSTVAGPPFNFKPPNTEKKWETCPFFKWIKGSTASDIFPVLELLKKLWTGPIALCFSDEIKDGNLSPSSSTLQPVVAPCSPGSEEASVHPTQTCVVINPETNSKAPTSGPDFPGSLVLHDALKDTQGHDMSQPPAVAPRSPSEERTTGKSPAASSKNTRLTPETPKNTRAGKCSRTPGSRKSSAAPTRNLFEESPTTTSKNRDKNSTATVESPKALSRRTSLRVGTHQATTSTAADNQSSEGNDSSQAACKRKAPDDPYNKSSKSSRGNATPRKTPTTASQSERRSEDGNLLDEVISQVIKDLSATRPSSLALTGATQGVSSAHSAPGTTHHRELVGESFEEVPEAAGTPEGGDTEMEYLSAADVENMSMKEFLARLFNTIVKKLNKVDSRFEKLEGKDN